MGNPSDHAAKIALISKQACFKTLTEKEKDGLARLFEIRHYRTNDVIVHEGDVVDSIFLIIGGLAKVVHEYVDNGVVKSDHIATLKAGDPIGLNDAGFYSLSGVRTATVIAQTDLSTLYLSVALFHGFAMDHPHVNFEMRKYAEKLMHPK